MSRTHTRCSTDSSVARINSINISININTRHQYQHQHQHQHQHHARCNTSSQNSVLKRVLGTHKVLENQLKLATSSSYEEHTAFQESGSECSKHTRCSRQTRTRNNNNNKGCLGHTRRSTNYVQNTRCSRTESRQLRELSTSVVRLAFTATRNVSRRQPIRFTTQTRLLYC